jgi:cytochrome c5
MRRSGFCACMLIFLSCLVPATTALKSESSPTGHDQSATSRAAQPTGEEVFKANCGRCHTPPMSISPRITGTVIMHMRTRARLSRQDEQLLLKYMAP